MAQTVGHYENDVIYTEGPFVISDVGGWRIECEIKGHCYPSLPDTSIYVLLQRYKKDFGKTFNKEIAIKVCDWLNSFVAQGRIILAEDGWWNTKGIGG